MRKYKRPSVSVLIKTLNDARLNEEVEQVGMGMANMTMQTTNARAGGKSRRKTTANQVLDEINLQLNMPAHKKLAIKKLTPIPTAGLLLS